MWSCNEEKLLIPLEMHHKAQSNEIFLFFGINLRELYFSYLLANPAEIAYLSVRDGELSHTAQLVEFRGRKVAGHTFWGCPKPGCSDGLCTGTIESHNFFVRTRVIPRTFKGFWKVY